MNEDYTFHEAVNAIDRGTITGRVFPRSFRDNHPISQLLCIDWRSDADMRGWLDFFGAKVQGSVAWADGWHGWSVLMTAHWSDVEDSGPVGIEQRHGSPPADPGTARPHVSVTDIAIHIPPSNTTIAALLAEGEQAAADLMCDPCIEASALRVTGQHRAEDLDRLPTVLAALDPDATIQMPCGQTTRHETHGSHTRHVDAYSRFCLGYCWDAPTVTIATQPLPPGVAGYAVAPDVHTGLPEPERDGWDDKPAQLCRVPFIRPASSGGLPYSVVSHCERSIGHFGDHVNEYEQAWANEYTAPTYQGATP